MRAVLAWSAVLVASAAFADDDVHVAKGPLPADEGVAITGRVSVDGELHEGPLTVVLTRCLPSDWADRAAFGGKLSFSAKDGDSFRFEGLVPGVFDLTVSGDGLATTVRKVEAYADSVDATVHVPLASSLRVHVTLGLDGKLEQAWVDVLADDHPCGSARPKGGVAEIEGLGPGRVWINARLPDDDHERFPDGFRGEAWAQVELRPGPNDVDVRITERAEVRLTARSARKGEFVEGVLRCRERPEWRLHEPFRVTAAADGTDVVAGMSDEMFGRHWLDPGAEFRVTGLTNGAFTLTVDALGFEPWEQRVVADGPSLVEAVLRPLPGRYITLSEENSDSLVQVEVRPATGGKWTPLLARDRRVIEFDGDDPPTLRAFLAPGRYEVSATTSFFVTTAPQPLDVTDDRTTIELTFPKLAVGHYLNGRTISRSGDLVRGVVLHVFLRDGDGWRALTAKEQVVTDGTFQVQGLAPGTYRLTYDRAGNFPLGQFDVADANVTRDFIVSRRPVPSAETGAPEHVAKGPLPADEGFVVAGTLVGDGDGIVHVGLGNVWVDLRPGERFRFVGVPPGKHTLSANGEGWFGGEEIAVFADVVGHEVRLPTTKIRGRIRPAYANASNRMEVNVLSAEGFSVWRLETAPGEEFETSPLSPGRYSVEIHWMQDSGEWWSEPRRWTFVDVGPEAKRLDFEFLAAASIRLALRSAGKAETFEGKVFDADLPDAAAFPFRVVAGVDGTLGTCVLEDGAFGAVFGAPRETVWLPNTPRGTHRLRFVAKGFETLERTVEIQDGITPLDVALTPVPGTFVAVEGWHDLFEVFVRPAEGGAWRSLLFADNRHVHLHSSPVRPRELLAPGKWQILATTADLAPSPPKTIEVGAEHAEVVVALDGVPGATLHGTLRTPSGAVLAETETFVFVRDGDAWRRLRAKAPTIDARGAFEIRGLAPGTYRIAFDESGSHVAGEFEILDADLTREFVFRRP